MWLNIKTGYTFKQVYGHLDQIAEKCLKLCNEAGINAPYGGIADLGNTFAHIPWEKACKKVGIKPIYGVQLPVVERLVTKERRYPYNWMTLIAKNTKGLQEIYQLVDLSFQQFYYRQRISYDQLNKTSHNIIVLSGIAPKWRLIQRSVYREFSPNTPFCNRFKGSIASIDNFYPGAEDNIIYEPFADDRLREKKTSPLHILNKREWLDIYPKKEEIIQNTINLASQCNAELPKAKMVKYIGQDNIEEWCRKSAKIKGLDISQGKYGERYSREIKLIKEKNYADYFLVVADLIRYAKTKMCVGPARGSSAGSLVCYLMGITEIDPLEYGLYFERFIDINRFDLPDIDIDFQDDKRSLALKYLEKKYGKDNVAQLGNINRLKPKSAINRFAKALGVPIEDTQELKDAIIERLEGDSRAKSCIEDTFTNTDIGKKFIENYPNMEIVKKIESHPSHTGVHAAGLLVSNQPITNYCGVNSKDNERIGMLDKKDAEKINLLKIDALGLRNLTIIAGVCDQLGKPYPWIYSIPVDDRKAYQVFNNHRFSGVFQFEGEAIQKLAKQILIENLDDISVLSAIGRPGPLGSGGAHDFIKFKNNPEKIKYLSDHKSIVNITKPTCGVIVYQEQMLAICREYGKLSWADTGAIRKATSKSLGEEHFEIYKKKFKEGALSQGETTEKVESVWGAMTSFGAYAFNKSHAISYGLISYLCAYFKGNHPEEFLVSSLNNAKNDQSALKILRDAVGNDGIKYVWFDKDKSVEKWATKDGILYGGFETLNKIGPVTAQKAVKLRRENKALPNSIQNKINKGESPFRFLYPGKEVYGDFYSDPRSHNLSREVSKIEAIKSDGFFTIIGCLRKKSLRDANEACFVSKRKGKFLNGNTSWLNITVEDDTGSIMCKINAKDYERFGKEIAEKGKEDKDWYLIYGNRINGWGIIFVKNIMKITR